MDTRKYQLFKTEMCRNWQEMGECRYSKKCRFAHGPEELRCIQRHARYRTEICKTFHLTGTCLYGVRCTFIHDEQPFVVASNNIINNSNTKNYHMPIISSASPTISSSSTSSASSSVVLINDDGSSDTSSPLLSFMNGNSNGYQGFLFGPSSPATTPLPSRCSVMFSSSAGSLSSFMDSTVTASDQSADYYNPWGSNSGFMNSPVVPLPAPSPKFNSSSNNSKMSTMSSIWSSSLALIDDDKGNSDDDGRRYSFSSSSSSSNSLASGTHNNNAAYADAMPSFLLI